MSVGTVPTKPCSPTQCRITDLMTHLWGISKAAVEAKVAAAEAKVVAVGSSGIFECPSTLRVQSEL